MIDRWLEPIFRPFRELRSKWRGIENIQANIKGDIGRLKADAGRLKKEAADAKKKIKEAADKGKEYQGKAKDAAAKAKEAAEKAQGAYGSALGQVKSGQQAMGGMMGGAAPPPGQMAAGMGQFGGQPMGGQMAGPGMTGAPPMGMPPQGAPGGYGAPMGGYGGAPPQQSNKTMAIMAGGANATAAMAWLVPLKGPQRGQLLQLKLNSVIGKDPSCDVCINDAFLSSRHATIKVANGVYVLEDHSTNGTFVNDRKVSRHELVDSDFVKVGQTLMKFKAL
jgi:hypothetical protein